MAAYRSQNYSKSSVGEYLNPVNGLRGRMEQQGKTPRNHARENVVALRQRQKENREKLVEAEEAASRPAAEWKLKQFRDVKSKLDRGMTKRQNGFESPHSPTSSPRHSSESSAAGSTFLRKGSLDNRLEQRQMKVRSPRLSPRKEPVKAPVPRERAQLAQRRNRDFISSNRTEAVNASPPKRSGKQDIDRKHDEFGTVPEYLRVRKEEWAEKERRRAAEMPDPNCPPGMVLMPESERLDTLSILKESEKEAHAALFKLPLQATNPSAIKRREALEAKLREIEAAKKMFSKERVYIAG